MVKKLLFTAFLGLSFIVGQAQNKIIPLNLSLWDPISIFKYDAASTTLLNVGILHNRSANVKGLTISTLFSTTEGRLNGLSINGVLGIQDSTVNGLTIAGLANVTSGEMNGFSAAGFINMSFDTFKGVQLAGVNNFNIGEFSGLQTALVANFAAGKLAGVQLSSGMNIAANEVRGLQLSGLLNVSMENLSGVQISLANYAREVDGVQIGLLNATGRGVRGVQIGLLNYSYEKTSLKLGLINVTPVTRLQLMLSTGNTQLVKLAARFRNKYTYTEIGSGIPSYVSSKTFSGEFSYRAGLIFSLKKFSISGDLGIGHIALANKKAAPGEPHKLYTLQGRINAEYQLFRLLGVFVSSGYQFNSRYGEFASYKSKPILEFGVSLF